MFVGERLEDLAAPPPLSAKLVAGPHGHQLVIVSSAASLLEGDELSVRIDLVDGAVLDVRSAAAQMAFPCLGPGSSRLDIEVNVGDGCMLRWRPEPLVAAAHCRHLTSARLSIEGTGRALWLDELVLGRSGEDVADIDVISSISVDRDGEPVVRDGFRTRAPGALGPAGIGTHRYLATLLDLGTSTLTDQGSMLLASGDRLQRILAPDARARPGAQLFGDA